MFFVKFDTQLKKNSIWILNQNVQVVFFKQIQE